MRYVIFALYLILVPAAYFVGVSLYIWAMSPEETDDDPA